MGTGLSVVLVPLPLKRLTFSLKAFTRSAIDFGGPFMMRQDRGKLQRKR